MCTIPEKHFDWYSNPRILLPPRLSLTVYGSLDTSPKDFSVFLAVGFLSVLTATKALKLKILHKVLRIY